MTGIYFGQLKYKLRETEQYYRILVGIIMNIFLRNKNEKNFVTDKQHNTLVAHHYPVKALLFKNYEL